MADPSRSYAAYVLGLLTAVYVLSVLDVQILALLVTPVRQELHITDTQIGLLISAGSAWISAIVGIPLARIADTHSRRGMIAAGLLLWSLCTTACGLAGGFEQLLLLRVGVSIGGAAFLPAAISLVPDYFAPEKRGTAFSVFQTGLYMAIGLSYLLGGLIAGMSATHATWTTPLFGDVTWWRVVFFAAGLPGVACALLLWTVREPERHRTDRRSNGVPVREVFAFIRRNLATLFCHNIAFAVLFLSMGAGVWMPTFFVRYHHWTAAAFARTYGPAVVVAGPLGLAFGSWCANRLAARGYHDAFLRVAIISAFVWIPVALTYLQVSNPWIAIAILPVGSFVAAMPAGLALAALTQITPAPMRGQVSAIYVALTPLGLSLGPTAVALVTDRVLGNDNLVGVAILIVSVTAHLAAGFLLWVGLGSYQQSLHRQERGGPSPVSALVA